MATPFQQTNPFQQQSNLNNPTSGAVATSAAFGTSGSGTPTHHHAGGTGIILTEAGLQSSAGIPPSFVPTPEPVYTAPTNPSINLLSSGGVRVGNITYIGSSVVPDTGGLTANEIRQQTISDFKQQGYNAQPGRFSAQLSYQQTPSIEQAPLQPTQGELLSTGGMLFLKPNEIKVTTIGEEREPSVQQKVVAQTERLLGYKEGSSGVVAVSYKDLNPSIEYNKAGQPLYSGGVTPVTPMDVATVVTLNPSIEYNKAGQPLYSGGVTPVTPMDVANVVTLPLGVARLGVIGGLKATQVLFSEPITRVYSNFVDSVIQRQDSGLAPSGALQQIGRGGLFLVSLPATGYAYGTEIVKGLVTQPSETIKGLVEYGIKNPYEIATVTFGSGLYEKFQTKLLEKPTNIEVNSAFEKQVQPFSRQRATLILQDIKTGDYIFGKTQAGEIISIGGGIEIGQTPTKAVLAELKQETGLLRNDLSSFEFKGKTVTPEETFYVYKGTLKEGSILKPTSDIREIVRISTAELLKYEGQTAKYPVDILTSEGYLRAYEAGLVKFAETGEKLKPLKITTDLGDYYLGNQSRYNVPAEMQLKYLKQGELLLAHGTPDTVILSILGETRKFEIDVSKTKRGQTEGLYVQPPVSPYKLPPSIFEETFMRKGTNIYLKTRQPKGQGLLNQKAGTFVKFAEPKQAGYIGLSYTGIFNTKPFDLSFEIGKAPKPTAYILKEKLPSKSLGPTPKTFSGAESELIFKEGYVKTIGTPERFNVGGKPLFVQEVKVVRDLEKAERVNEALKKITSKNRIEQIRAAKELKDLTGIDYLPKENVRYVEPTRIYSYGKELVVEKNKYTNELYKEIPKRVVYEVTKEFTREIPRETFRTYETPREIPRETFRTYETPRETTKQIEKITNINYYEENKRKGKPVISNIFLNKEKEPRVKTSQVPTYNVLLRRRGKFLPIATNLGKSEALFFGSNRALKDLGRTFKLKQIGTKEVFTGFDEQQFMPSENLFRGYKIRKGQRIQTPNQYTQLTSANLQSSEEKQQLADARRLNKLINAGF